MTKIRLLENRYAAALVARDLDAVMRTYSPGEDLFIFEAVPPRQFVGAKAYRQHVQEFLVNFQAPFSYEVREVAVTIAGDVAYGHNIQHLVGVDRGKRIDMTLRAEHVVQGEMRQWSCGLRRLRYRRLR